MSRIAITGFGSYLPRLSHTNQSLPPLEEPPTAEEIERIGVFRRGWAGDGESVPEMAAAAGRAALERAGVKAESLDAIILANWTQRRYIPEHAPRVQQLLGARQAFAYDVSGACTGFIYGSAMAHAFLQEPRFQRILVCASETTSQRARPRSKGTLILADGAGAWVLERGRAGMGELIDFELATDGDQHGIMDISQEGWVRTHLPQRELNALAGRSFRKVIDALLARQKMALSDITWFVPHSGTAGVQAAVQKELGIAPEKVLTNYAEVGNVSSASIPVALDHFTAQGKIRRGDLVLSAAVGTGWYSAAMLYRP
jgi:3-oxoacyl-[acyl-carrier-protein] synthase-3